MPNLRLIPEVVPSRGGGIAEPNAFMRARIVEAVRHAFAQNFQAEASGQGAWPPLARSTLIDRALKGFPPGPKLVRTGAYRRSFLEAGAEEFRQQATGWTLWVGSDSAIAPYHEEGTAHMPARSVTLLSSQQADWIVEVITSLLDQA